MVATFQTKTALRATGLAMLSMLVLLALILIVESYNSDRSKAAITAHRAAHVVATQYDWMFEASAHALERIEDAVAAQGPGSRAGVIQSLGNAVRDLPQGFHYSVYGTTGDLTHSSLPKPMRNNVASAPWFAKARSGTALAIAPMITDPATGAQSFLMVQRLDLIGRFAGVATISIPVTTLSNLADNLGIEGLSTVALIASDGMLIGRSPPITPMDLSSLPIFNDLDQSHDGTFETLSPIDHVERIVGYWRLSNWPVVATAGLDHAFALRPFWHDLLTAGLLALPILLGMGWLVLDLVQLLRVDEQRQRALTEAIERSNFLLREIHHRVKNNLQTVGSLIRLENLPTGVQTGLLGRLGAMVAVHEAMYRSDEFEEICIAPYLERLIDNVAKSQGCEVTTHIDIAAIRLSGDRAMQLGLLVNELVANAFKHAFVPRGHGTLTVLMHDAGTGRLTLVVADDGPGFDPETTDRQMGSRLIDAFASQLGGSVTIDTQGGTTVTVDFPQDYGPTADPPPQRSAQDRSIAGARSIASIRASKLGRSSKRT